MVAEVVPEHRRVEAGALLYTSAPFGLFLATFANFQIAGVLLQGRRPRRRGAIVFLCGLIPAAVAFVVRMFVREPERWREAAAAGAARPRFAELFTPENRALTLSAASRWRSIALIAWWSVNAFIPIVSSGLAQATAKAQRLRSRRDAGARRALEGARHQRLQPGRPHRHAADHPGGQGDGPAQDVRALLLPVGRGDAGHLRPRSAAAAAPLHVLLHRPHGVRRLRQLHLLPARALPHAPARHAAPASATTSAASSPPPARSWSAPSRRAARTRCRRRSARCSGSASSRSSASCSRSRPSSSRPRGEQLTALDSGRYFACRPSTISRLETADRLGPASASRRR